MIDPSAEQAYLIVSLLKLGLAGWAIQQLLGLLRLRLAPPPPQAPPLSDVVPMTENARAWLDSWPEGWEREQAEATLREQMQVLGDWDKAVARLSIAEG